MSINLNDGSAIGDRDRNTWAKEEIADAVKKFVADYLATNSPEASDVAVLKRQRDRVIKFLGVEKIK